MADITLSDINRTLRSQSDVLRAVAENTETTSRAIDFLAHHQKLENKRSIEDELESRKNKAAMPAEKEKVKKESKGWNMPPGLGRLGMIGGAGIGAMWAPQLVKSLFANKYLRTGLLGGLAIAIGDDIANWIESETGSKELAAAADRAMLGGAFGSFFGARFGILAAALGAMATPENLEKISEIGGNLKTLWDEDLAPAIENMFSVFGDLDLTFEGIGAGLASWTSDALDGLVSLTAGDLSEFSDNAVATATLLGSMGLLMAPKGMFAKSLLAFTAFARGPLGKKFLGIAAAIAAGTYVFSNFFDDDGEIGMDDVGGGIVTAGAAGLAGRYAWTSATAGIRRMAGMPPRVPGGTVTGGGAAGPGSGNNYIRRGNMVMSKAGQWYKVGSTQANMIMAGRSPVVRVPWWKTAFPKLGGVVSKIPGISMLFAVLDGAVAYQVYHDRRLTKQDRNKKLGGIIGRNIGAIGFGILGTLIGGPIGGFVGGLVGYMAGEWAGEKIMEWLNGDIDEQDILDEIAGYDIQGNAVFTKPGGFNPSIMYGANTGDLSKRQKRQQRLGNRYATAPNTWTGNWIRDNALKEMEENRLGNVTAITGNSFQNNYNSSNNLLHSGGDLNVIDAYDPLLVRTIR